MTSESSRASETANGKDLRSFTKRWWSLAISLDPELHLTEGFPFSLPFFSRLWAWLCQSLATLHILLLFLLSWSAASFTSVQAIPSHLDLWLQTSDPGISVTYLDFLFHSEDLPALTRQIRNFRSQGWDHSPYCSSSSLKTFPHVLLPRQNRTSQFSSARVLRQSDIAVRGKDKIWFATGYTAM